MTELIKWLSATPTATTVILILISVVILTTVTIVLISFLQGREISFWPPKIGVKPTPLKSASNSLKSDIEKDILRIKRDVITILDFHIMERLNNKFDINLDLTTLSQIKPDEKPPTDTDKPHILYFSIDKKIAKRGDVINILFYVKDDGFNYPNDINEKYAEIIDSTNNAQFPARTVIGGYYLTQIHISDNAVLGYHKIIFKLTDFDKNEFSQSIRINVEQ